LKEIRRRKEQRKIFSEREIWRFAYQMAYALAYLNFKMIIHRDLTCKNIMLSEDQKIIKIADLGILQILQSASQKNNEKIGNAIFSSPELMQGLEFSDKTDIWSMGCILYHMAAMGPAFRYENSVQEIFKEKQPDIPKMYSERLQDFIDRLLTKDQKYRPDAKTVLSLIPGVVKKEFEMHDSNPLAKSLVFAENQKSPNKLKMAVSAMNIGPISPVVVIPSRKIVTKEIESGKRNLKVSLIYLKPHTSQNTIQTQKSYTIKDYIHNSSLEVLRDFSKQVCVPKPKFNKKKKQPISISQLYFRKDFRRYTVSKNAVSQNVQNLDSNNKNILPKIIKSQDNPTPTINLLKDAYERLSSNTPNSNNIVLFQPSGSKSNERPMTGSFQGNTRYQRSGDRLDSAGKFRKTIESQDKKLIPH